MVSQCGALPHARVILGQVKQDAPKVVPPAGQEARAITLHPRADPGTAVAVKEPAQLPPVAVGQHALDQQVAVLCQVQRLQVASW
jgi:hypothetical protein